MTADILPYSDAYGLRWSVINLTPSGVFRAPLEHSIMLWASLTIVAILGLTIIAGVLARRILAPIGDLTQKASAIAAGDFDQPVTVSRDD